MAKTGIVTKILAVAGTALAWFPLLAPIAITLIAFAAAGVWRFDYLMPAELFPVAFLGGGLLLWAAWRARMRRRQIAMPLMLMIALLAGGQALAVATGLASGAAEPAGWRWIAVLASLALYALALLAAAAAGTLLVRDLFRRGHSDYGATRAIQGPGRPPGPFQA